MKKILLLPDSFKGTMTSIEVCQIMKASIKNRLPDVNVISLPVADGGEGSCECFLMAVGGTKHFVTVKNPFFEDIETYFITINEGRTAVIEVAAAIGLPLVEDRKNPKITTTYGVGELISHALKSGVREIIVALGGSSTNDGGCGMAAALGVKFYDKEGKFFIPAGESLSKIDRIDMSNLLPEFKDINIRAMCDITNPLYGEKGAAFIFAPQKGASSEDVKELDFNLTALAETVKKELKIDVAESSGAGAAGGLGFGIKAFLNGNLERGIDLMLDAVSFEKIAKDADLIITGEGKIDLQSLDGKVVAGVGKRAKTMNIPVIAIVGDIGDNIDGIYDMGISAVFSINQVALPFSKAKLRCKSDMEKTVDNIARLIKIGFGFWEK